MVHLICIQLTGEPESTAEALIELAGVVERYPPLGNLKVIRLRSGELLDEPLSAIGIKPRLCSSLSFHRGIHTIGQLVKYTEKELYHPHKVGKPSVDHIKHCLESVGLSLRASNPASS